MGNEANAGEKQSRQLSISETLLSLIFRALPVKHGKHRLLDRDAPKAWNKSGKPVTLSIHGCEVIVDPNDLGVGCVRRQNLIVLHTPILTHLIPVAKSNPTK